MNREQVDLSHLSLGNLRGREFGTRYWSRFFRRPDLVTFLWGVTLGLAVCAPLLGAKRVFLLDWTIGPHVVVANSSALGLNGGLTTGILGSAIMAVLNRIIGSASTWLLIFAFFPIAVVGAGRLAGRSSLSRVAAGTLYAVNPFVFNRLYAGHIALLFGYALLPFATAAALRSVDDRPFRWTIVALWWSLLTALSPHFAWIFGVIVVGVALFSFRGRNFSTRRFFGWALTIGGVFAITNSYIYLPHLVTNLSSSVGQASLDLYRTTGDPHLGLFTNVLGLYGFWRLGPGPELPKDAISGWPFLFVAILAIVLYGLWGVVRKPQKRNVISEDTSGVRIGNDKEKTEFNFTKSLCEQQDVELLRRQRTFAFFWIFVGVSGFLLALGSQGPTGGLFTWSYNHIPFFAIMREPQKFLMLLALAYAVLFGWGVERFRDSYFSTRSFGKLGATLLLGVALPLSYSANIFNGLARQVVPSPLPSSYARADAMMGTGPGNILYLPWHLYMSYPFSQGRVINNVGSSSFRRNVISGDDVELGDVLTQSTSPRSTYLVSLFENAAKIQSFGALVAPLGVRYVVLAKTVDWLFYDRWFSRQNDLRRVLTSSSLVVWQNEDYGGVGLVSSKLTGVSGVGGLLALEKQHALGSKAFVNSIDAANASTTKNVNLTSEASLTTSAVSNRVKEISPIAYEISPGPPGWASVDVPYQKGWTLNGVPVRQSVEGTVLVRVNKHGGLLIFSAWSKVRLGYLISSVTFVGFLVLVFVDRRKKGKKRADVDFWRIKQS